MNLQTFIPAFLSFLNNSIMPALMTVAFVAFLWNATKYFIIQSDSEEGQTQAKSLAFWSIAAFVVITSFWGILNMLIAGLGLPQS